MKYVEPGYEIVSCPDNALERIEKAARTCYKSDENIRNGSAERIVKVLIRKRHFAMIEFGGVIHVKFMSNRGFTHELVRHRLASFAQESTRYCNYSKDKFGNEISNISTHSMAECYIKDPEAQKVYLDSMDQCFRFCEAHYLKMVEVGVPPELARECLNIGLKAEINIMADLTEWRHIFKLRCSKKAHPRMRELMIPLLLDIRDRIPFVFDDIIEEVEVRIPTYSYPGGNLWSRVGSEDEEKKKEG